MKVVKFDESKLVRNFNAYSLTYNPASSIIFYNMSFYHINKNTRLKTKQFGSLEEAVKYCCGKYIVIDEDYPAVVFDTEIEAYSYCVSEIKKEIYEEEYIINELYETLSFLQYKVEKLQNNKTN